MRLMNSCLLGTALNVAMMGCAPDDTCGPPMSGNAIELFTWWNSESEGTALRTLTTKHQELHPDVRFYPTAFKSADDARAGVEARFAAGYPLDSFQINVGTSLDSWVRDGTILEAIPNALSLNWSVFHQELVDAVSVGGNPYCVPIDLHRLNTLFYNAKLLKELKLNVPRTLAELEEACVALAAANKTPIVLPLPREEETHWELSLLVHESLLPAMAGAKFYEDFWRGMPRDAQAFAELNKVYQKVVVWKQQGWLVERDLKWDEVTRRHFLGPAEQAAFYVMGDWAKGELESNGFIAGLDFGSVQFPGDETAGRDTRVFVYTSDCFPLVRPKVIEGATAGIHFLETVASQDAQLAFSSRKGSLPALKIDQPDVDLDLLQRDTRNDFVASDTFRVLAISGLAPPTAYGDYSDALLHTLDDEDVDWGLRFWKNRPGRPKPAESP